MEGNAYVFYHPQYGGLRVVKTTKDCSLHRGPGCHHGYRQRYIVPGISRHGGKSGRNIRGSGNQKVPKDFKPRLFSVNSLAMLTR